MGSQLLKSGGVVDDYGFHLYVLTDLLTLLGPCHEMPQRSGLKLEFGLAFMPEGGLESRGRFDALVAARAATAACSSSWHLTITVGFMPRCIT